MKYINSQYWPQLHHRLKGQLRAVGHPFLSENLNRLKYNSEAQSLEQTVRSMVEVFQISGKDRISFLDVGAGTGFWTDLISSALRSERLEAEITVLDISEDALDVIADRIPEARKLQEDLATISPQKYAGSFDLVTAFYCLHHIVRSNDFLNALRFAGSSVKQGGFLLIMDPVLTRAYSQYDVMDQRRLPVNGIPRHLYFIDDILSDVGFQRCSMIPAVSYILNGCIEAHSFLGYWAMSKLWKLLCIFYKSEQVVRIAGGVLMRLDTSMKRLNAAYSSSICLYQKVGGDGRS